MEDPQANQVSPHEAFRKLSGQKKSITVDHRPSGAPAQAAGQQGKKQVRFQSKPKK